LQDNWWRDFKCYIALASVNDEQAKALMGDSKDAKNKKRKLYKTFVSDIF